MTEHKFTPETPVKLDPPKDDPITMEQLIKCDGVQSDKLYIAIKGQVFDVTANQKSYGVGSAYHSLVGRDASRALGKMSLGPEETNPSISWDYSSLTEQELRVMNDWYMFFKNRYNIVGRISKH
ncbi:hypothetical protein FOA43_002201 [Brettanomyces nanus]|uniref:Cytochrome b5 heme-binding domain-containing protein n=1 Tax=Eeniella nana TaxID=13502 RepID=A0A875S3C1_EENNA|nr:uncharacterized protein FOA43_002201 [Brettanomyces nanus]QPG74865.1 hypothetical protein FOA43_002201 [Brettanomyces nanus]